MNQGNSPLDSATYPELAKMIDHALLRPNLTSRDYEAGLRLAMTYEVASVCISPHALSQAALLLDGSGVLPSTVIGFPHGGLHPKAKFEEARIALAEGARELDMVVNVSKVKDGRHEEVRAEIKDIFYLVRDGGAKLKVIFENAYLSKEEKVALCEICGELEVDWVKTSTGFAPSGWSPEDVKLMRKHSPPKVGVKASGGIRSLDDLLLARELGATRVGASATSSILEEARQRLALPLLMDQNAGPKGSY